VEADGGQDFTKKASWQSFLEVDVESAGFGKAASLGSLSVPPSWPVENRKAESSPPDTPVDPGAAGRSRGRKFREGLMGMVTGRRANTDEERSSGD
jgi:hypothetical protein